MTTGRFAPSPSGPLHLGNLRTALLAWCFARSEGGRFLIRVDDLTTEAAALHEAQQLADLATLGLTHDPPVVRQSERRDHHARAVDDLVDRGLTYPCFCTRREIREAAAAPHGPGPEGAYPGTCAHLDPQERERRMAQGRPPAIRLRAGAVAVAFHDELHGEVASTVDDFVLRRGDGVVAYNVTVVVDDADAGVDQVVRGDDLLDTTPRQVLLQRLLGLPTPRYAHVPLALGSDGDRLAKRHGAVGLSDQLAAGRTPAEVLGVLAASLGLAAPGEELSATDVLHRFDPATIPRGPWVPPADILGTDDPPAGRR